MAREPHPEFLGAQLPHLSFFFALAPAALALTRLGRHDEDVQLHQKLASKLSTMVERHVVKAIPMMDTSAIRLCAQRPSKGLFICEGAWRMLWARMV